MTDLPAGYYPLIVRGGPATAASYDAGVLTVHFLHAPVAAGDAATYGGLPPGSAAWVDRPLNAQEPLFLEYATEDTEAAAAASGALADPERFWRFGCAYDATKQCFVAALSEPVSAGGGSDHADQLARLGAQVVAALTAAYDPDGDSTLALALHPGQALADGIVQDGVTNVLRLSEWIGNQYDYPMLLALADGTPVVSTSLGGVTARSAYATMARWSQPGVRADSPSFPRLAQLLSDARQDIGEHPETLPFGVEPTDFALADCPAWQVFDVRISAHAGEVTTTLVAEDADPPATVAPTVEPNPDLWKIRAISEVAIGELAKRRLVREEVQRFSAELPSLTNETVVARLQETRDLVTDAAPVSALGASALRDLVVPDLVLDQAVVASDVVVADPDVTEGLRLDAILATELVNVYASDLANEGAVSTATTSDSSLHVHFEYLVLRIDRLLAGRPWWRPEFLAETAWFVPGMRRGALVPDSDDPAYGHCLPQSLLLVRNVSLTGVWSDAAKAAMDQSVHYFGPFLMSSAAATQTATTELARTEQTTVLGLGVQVIGELCSRLPVLPPMDDPALARLPQRAAAAAAAARSTQRGTSP